MAESGFRGAVFRRDPFTISLGAGLTTHMFRFPVRPAREWLETLGSNNWIVATVATLPTEDYERFLDQVEAGVLGTADVLAFAHSALAQSAGRPWWEAERLAASCFSDNGRLLGTVLMGGADLSRMTLAMFLACVWATLVRGQDAEGLTKLEVELTVPPPEATEEERAGLEDDMFSMVERARSIPGVHIG